MKFELPKKPFYRALAMFAIYAFSFALLRVLFYYTIFSDSEPKSLARHTFDVVTSAISFTIFDHFLYKYIKKIKDAKEKAQL